MPTVTCRREPTSIALHVAGDLLSTNAKDLRAAVEDLLAAPEKQTWLKTLVLDLTGAKMVDSVGLNLIVAILRAVRIAGGTMTLKHDNPNVHRILLFTRLDQQLTIQNLAA
jgi:anti-anti-sigma factor